ncbi:MAG TPA: M28 family peptidase [Solirubrobacteraceae bacterium]|nr:M28 family peptidase [Solirubrobacteraceae bacterium]
MSERGPSLDDAAVETILREVVETLAPLERTPCSAGEREAAQWLAERLRDTPGVRVELEEEDSWGTFPPTSTGLGLLGLSGALSVLCGRRATGGLLALAAFAGIVDEAHNGPRLLRRAVRRRRRTVNVIATIDAGGGVAEQAQSTLVVHAHHDAPQTGALFDQTLQRRLYERAPQVLERFKTPLPQWWIGLGGCLATIVSALSGRRGFARAGAAVGLLGTAAVADIWRNETVQGANDNLSGVAALVALAQMLRDDPVPGLRVLLVSCGAEETLQDGVRAYVARHRGELDPARTAFLNLDTVGSPHLVLLEAEGPVKMEEYTGPWLRDLVAERAERLGIALQRGFRARASTDSVIPSRAGYATAALVSMTDWRSPANYHLPSDVPANLDYASVADAARLVFDVAHALPRTPDGALPS